MKETEVGVWLEPPTGIVVGWELVSAADRARALAALFERATLAPLRGQPRTPERARVASDVLAAELSRLLGGLTVVAAPTPELDDIGKGMLEWMAAQADGAEPSYLENGAVQADTVAGLFVAARALYACAPWQALADSDVLRLDIPELGIEGACVSVLGAAEEVFGFAIFPTLAGFQAFADQSEELPQEGAIDFGSSWLSLSFENGAELPASVLEEVRRHRWTVAGEDAYPLPEGRERDGEPRPLEERDVEILTACAAALATLIGRHRATLEEPDFEPISETYGGTFHVRLTLPYESFDEFEPEPVSEPRPRPTPRLGGARIGRNDACPCGSGKKYKKCHLRADEAVPPASPSAHEGPAGEPEGRSPLHRIDERMVRHLRSYAEERFGSAFRRARDDFEAPEECLQLLAPWAVYGFPLQGRPVLAWYLEERGARLSTRERHWLEAQSAAWLSVWEVQAVAPGESITLRDLLTESERTVEEVSASKQLRVRDAVLARVVECDGTSVLCGMHAHRLPPRAAAAVVEQVRAKLRLRRAVPAERLRDGKVGRRMIQAWEAAVRELSEAPRFPQKLLNTDGDPLLLTIDHFDFHAASRPALTERLRALSGVEPADDERRSYSVLRPGNAMHKTWDNTVVGHLTLEGGELRVETNSMRRADTLRAELESGLGDLVRHRLREHSDPLAQLADPNRRPAPSRLPASPDALALLHEVKRQQYSTWLDTPLPALGDRTPRETVRNRRGRARVDLLLREMEHLESRLPELERFEFATLREALGLAESQRELGRVDTAEAPARPS